MWIKTGLKTINIEINTFHLFLRKTLKLLFLYGSFRKFSADLNYHDLKKKIFFFSEKLYNQIVVKYNIEDSCLQFDFLKIKSIEN